MVSVLPARRLEPCSFTFATWSTGDRGTGRALAALCDVLRRGHGRIVNVSSSAGLTIVPGLARANMSEAALSCGEASIEPWFNNVFTREEHVSPHCTAALATHDVTQIVAAESLFQ